MHSWLIYVYFQRFVDWFEWQSDSEGEADTERHFFYLEGVGSLPRWQQWPVLGPANRRSLEFQPVNRDWDVWTIFCCFPRCINKELDQKQSIKDRHSYSLPSWPATHSESHFLQCGQRSLAEANDASSFKAQVAAGVRGRSHDTEAMMDCTQPEEPDQPWHSVGEVSWPIGSFVIVPYHLDRCFKTAMRHLIISQRPKTF